MKMVSRRATVGLTLLAGLALSACSTPETYLTGKRLPPRAVMSDQVPGDNPTVPANQVKAISLPKAVANADWTQGAGTPSTRTTNPALSGNPTLAWSTSIGAGETRKTRITGTPVVAGGVVYTMDALGSVAATSTSGAHLWSASVVPPGEKAYQGSGGALAYGDGKLFVASGFGTLSAMDPATGKVIWVQKLLASATGAPTVYGKLVYVTAGEDEAWAISTDDGRVQWTVSAVPDVNNFSGAPSPAVNDQYAVFGFGSGQVEGVFRKGGMRQWNTPVSGRRLGYARSNMTDITGAPVIVGNTVYAGNQAGRMVAINLADGTRLWTADEGPMNPVWVAGGAVFLTSDDNELVRLDAATGKRVWGVQLPFYQPKRKPKKIDSIYAQFGPVLAGGRLAVASSDGKLRFFDPTSGTLVQELDLPGGAASAPVVAGGTLYVLSKDGKLLAYR
ncbi:PQQ-like beta-propeller repeat protein [Pseudooceanicola sp. CBS1P-1]|uniref:PQQ-binding-like beta-propeller repeat protein n=2 Tax=Paracoccaceae TaxID=31989 RepID=A0A6L7FYT2_9RHOB|nr:PQQ-like beta-propeller repeat protein [Pseudooceanicola endophyticus]MXN16829.1 PQQ-binding-like beta-propeller repeat protein [Pseudooceanicola albus]